MNYRIVVLFLAMAIGAVMNKMDTMLLIVIATGVIEIAIRMEK